MTRRLPEVTLSEYRGVRYLHLDTPWIQGGMRLAKPDSIELEYVKRMMAWLLVFDADDDLTTRRAVQLGLGAGAITRFCAGVLGMTTRVVELNPGVIDACRAYFRLPPDGERLQVINGDAGAWAADPANHGSVDALCVDLYDHEAAAPVLDTPAFYRNCHALLATGGAMTVNLFGRDASFAKSRARIAAAFGEDHVVHLLPTAEGNTVVLAMKQVTLPGRALLARRAENIETRWGLPGHKWLRLLRPPPRPGPASAAVPAPLPDVPPA